MGNVLSTVTKDSVESTNIDAGAVDFAVVRLTVVLTTTGDLEGVGVGVGDGAGPASHLQAHHDASVVTACDTSQAVFHS